MNVIMKAMLPELEWETDRQYNEFAKLVIGPFTITAKKSYEEYYSDYDDGKGISDPEPGAIRHRNGDRNSYPWFLPSMTAEEHYNDLARDSRWTIEEARQEASKYAMQDYQRWADYGQGWSYMYLGVEITYRGYEIGGSGCGGIESDSDDEYFTEMIWESMGEAINQALNALDDFRDAPSYLLVELDAKIDAAFKASREWHEQHPFVPEFHGKPYDPKAFPRDPKDIPAYVPVDEDEYRVILCQRCEESNITDDEYCYTFGKGNDFKFCADCYYELYEQAKDELIRLHDESCGENGVFYNISVYDVEQKMVELYKEEISE